MLYKLDPRDHMGLVFSISQRFTDERPLEDTEIFGEACVGLVIACQKYNGSTKPSTFITTVIRNKIVSFLREKKRIHTTELVNYIPQIFKDKIEESDMINWVISKCPKKYRGRLKKRYLKGMTSAEIAEEEKISESAVNTSLRKAKTVILKEHKSSK
jgi:RNA polymerase sigma factor (sigma-70 family)